MGDTKKQRRKYSRPKKRWEKERIEDEKVLLEDYGLKNKKEIWKMESILKNFARQAKKLIASQTNQAAIEKIQLFKKLSLYGLVAETAKLEDVLAITLKDILERRLQTLVYRKNLARSIKQSRQFIVHKHIMVGDSEITAPSYLVLKQEEPLINFVASSSLFSQEHPERAILPKKKKEHKKKENYGKRPERRERQGPRRERAK